MDVREKLVELLGANTCKCDCCEDCEYCEDEDACIAYLKNSMADYLIAHGVTVQEFGGCEYCKGEFIGETPIVTLGSDCGIDSIVEDEFLYNFCNCGIKSIVKINFCPMCGRRLPKPPKGE